MIGGGRYGGGEMKRVEEIDVEVSLEYGEMGWSLNSGG